MDGTEITTRGKTQFQMSSEILKYIAIVAMTIDHVAWGFVPEESALGIIMHTIGRITGPIMLYSAVEGYHHTRNIHKYLIRLAVFALISWVPFLFYFEADSLFTDFNPLDLFRPNVIYTILLGVLAIHIRRKMKNPVLKTVLILCLIILCVPADWGTVGILIIIVFDYFYGNFKHQVFGYCLIVLLGVGVLYTFTYPFSTLFYEESFTFGFVKDDIINLGLFLPLMLLYFYNGQKGRGGRFSKWFFYIFYPLHLIVLGLLKMICG